MANCIYFSRHCRTCLVDNTKVIKKGIVLLLHTQLKNIRRNEFLFCVSLFSDYVHSAITWAITIKCAEHTINISCLWFCWILTDKFLYDDNELHLITHAIKLYESCHFWITSRATTTTTALNSCRRFVIIILYYFRCIRYTKYINII